MNESIRSAFEHEMHEASAARARGEREAAFARLERAHILGQRSTRLHVRSHLAMLALGWERRDARETWGQLTRLLAAALFSRIWVPLGNTGSANVSALRPMPLPPDLAKLLGVNGTSARERRRN